ncbi:16S rRNA methyltransferase [Thermocladium modestius]|uniref:16S rRNA methyltransferase n=1 Tax=Thermocladium modestius TaxID=62609 RepID=A0A830GT11_9CREN|nr:ribosome biogenesis protein [Thermocladium modestius]GGP19125.1 16S rRNA methyltransferase [Thermocladium modestius]
MLTLILAEAALEVVNGEVLDVSRHRSVIRRLPNPHKRGRPDIVHLFLLTAMGSPLSAAGLLRVLIHTVNDEIIIVDPRERPPQNYNNFIGLMRQLFRLGSVPPSGSPLLRLVRGGIGDAVSLSRASRVVMLDDSRGVKVPARDLARRVLSLGDVAVIMGGFPHGSFEESTYAVVQEAYRIGDRPMRTHEVACRFLAMIESELGYY